MKNIMCKNNLLDKYEKVLAEIVTLAFEQLEGYQPLMLFLTTSDQSFILTEVIGEMSTSEFQEATSLIDQCPQHSSSEYFQMFMIEIRDVMEQETKDILYFGMILPRRTSNYLNIDSFLNGLVTMFHKVKMDLPFSVLDLLQESSFDITLQPLVNTFTSRYQLCCKREVMVFQRQDDHFYPLIPKLDFPSLFELHELNSMIQSPREQSCCLIAGEAISSNSDNAYILYPIYIENELTLIFFFQITNKKGIHVGMNHYEQWFKPFVPLFQKAYLYEREQLESKRRELLLHVMKKFHSTMKSEDVLHAIVDAIHEAFPDYLVYLLLSQEWKGKDGIPIKPLLYGNEVGSKVVEHAYVTGEIQIAKGKEKLTLFVPLRGKQGVYGVMEIKAPNIVQFPKEEVEFIQMLADTGGNALENAELYQQSRHLIQDLRLINETTHQLNEHRRLSDTVHYMTSQIIESFGAEEVGFILLEDDDTVKILEESTSLFHTAEISDLIAPLLEKIRIEKEPIYIGELELYDVGRVPGYQSVLVVPMIHNQELKGIVIALHHNAYHFTFAHFKLLQSMIHHSTLAMTNSMLHEELERLVITDHLTELYSRNYLDEQIQKSMEEGNQGTFLLIDIDDFKKINDTYGHQVGDQVIIQVATILKELANDYGLAARWGGEELALYLPETHHQQGRQLAKIMLQRVKMETNPTVTVSVGISYWHSADEAPSLNQLFQQADQSLYDAKESGKDRCVIDESLIV